MELSPLLEMWIIILLKIMALAKVLDILNFVFWNLYRVIYRPPLVAIEHED